MSWHPQVFRPLELGFSDPESRGWSGTHAVKCNLGPDEDEESSCEQNLFGGGNPIHSCRLAWMSMFNQGSTTSTGCGDPLATPATIWSWPHQQVDWQHLMSTSHPLYPIAIDCEWCSPLTHSSLSIPSSSLSPSVRIPSSKVLVPHLFCLWKPHTLLMNASITMSWHCSLLFVTPRYALGAEGVLPRG